MIPNQEKDEYSEVHSKNCAVVAAIAAAAAAAAVAVAAAGGGDYCFLYPVNALQDVTSCMTSCLHLRMYTSFCFVRNGFNLV